MPKPKGRRTASHRGSWYESGGELLASQIAGWLDAAAADCDSESLGRVRAIIAPHAGYRYCGHVMAYAYKYLVPSQIKRVFLLGPSHHFFSRECHLSPHAHFATPLGDAPLDGEVCAALAATGRFAPMSAANDEAEHSLELHMPFLMAAMRGHPFSLVPIVVGALTGEGEATYGAALAPYLTDPSNFFIISSDFCHWGTRFNFTAHDAAHGPVHASIRALDGEGMAAIEALDPGAFGSYLRRTSNTICGRHPIAVFLRALEACPAPHAIRFTKYDQSCAAMGPRDSSVSYASAAVTLVDEDAGGAKGS